ncbi:B3 domain-containing transcription factor VRN1-like [Olea europaea var. sylvestris]|uniref:B3 domain-containing transcription factor VRN1-like n=1 Tax=Olea europaea var. sylvestris TaxID=158386 RepID=UPI000C1D22B4|nr:B3 domain-containing transcription factor VRN1-like [Olea europaea var. sylvestris]
MYGNVLVWYSKICKVWDNEKDIDMYTSMVKFFNTKMNVPHIFFKIIDGSLNHNIRLMFPTSFVNCWRQELGDRVRLTSYDGIIVTIQLQTIDGEIYFTNGWEQFFDHHNLQDVFVVVFGYNGNSTFNMRIFDHSRSEVTYDSDIEEDEALYLDNPVFEITLTLNQNNHREIAGYL